MLNSASIVFKNKQISSKIFDFLGNDKIRAHFPPKPKQTLIYGQVQSGKTAKIMDYIKNSSSRINILIIQNSLSMLAQYERAFKTNNVKFYSVSSSNSSVASWYIRNTKSKLVLLVMNNNYRRSELDNVLKQTKLSDYLLVMDESDMYFNSLKESKLYKNAVECVHVTATPFPSGYKSYFDEIIVIPPKKEYISFDKLDIKFIPEVTNQNQTIMNIVSNDFMKKKQGIMLITLHNRIVNMVTTAYYLSRQPSLIDVPVVILSSKNLLYYNKKTKELPRMSIPEIISGLETHQHIIFIANRLASRGINYSDLTYNRHLTHQLISQNDNKTNFIQRCRILGNKQGMKEKLKLYCLNCSEEYFGDILEKIKKLEKNVDSLKLGYVEDEYHPKKLKLVRCKTM
jgi:hypothetical protein